MSWTRLMRSKGLNAAVAAVLSFSMGLPPAWALQAATLREAGFMEEGVSPAVLAARESRLILPDFPFSIDCW